MCNLCVQGQILLVHYLYADSSSSVKLVDEDGSGTPNNTHDINDLLANGCLFR